MRQIALTRITAGLLLVALPASAPAQGVLEQLQSEVASVAQRARASVVTIEDTRSASYSSMTLPGLPAAAGQHAAALALGAESARMGQRQIEIRQQIRKARAAGRPQEAASLEDGLKAEIDAQVELRTSKKSLEDSIGKAMHDHQLERAIFITDRSPKAGSGFSVGDGYVVTTADVLRGMQAPVVVTSDGTRIKASVAGIDETMNIGLVRLSGGATLPALTLGDSSTVRIGHFGITLSVQGGDTGTAALLLVGNIRSHGTSAGSHFYPSLFQVDGTLGAGSSGAPLLNARGDVVGVIVGAPAGDYAQVYMDDSPQDSNPHVQGGRSLPVLPAPLVAPRYLSPETPDGLAAPAAPPADPRLFPEAPDAPQAPNIPSSDVLGPDFEREISTVVDKAVQDAGAAASDTNAKKMTPEQRKEVRIEIRKAMDTARAGIKQARKSLEMVKPLTWSMASLPRVSTPFFRPAVTSAGFASPINSVRQAIETLKAGRKTSYGYLGVRLAETVTETRGNSATDRESHVTVQEVSAGSAAASAGFQRNDEIVSVDGVPVSSVSALKAALVGHVAGQTVQIGVKRAGELKTLSVTLAVHP